MKESWEEQLRQKLEGHKMAPPEGLWDDIYKELRMIPEPVLTPSARSTSKRWYFTVAAVLLAIAGFFAIYQFNNSNETKAFTAKSKMSSSEQSDAAASEDNKDFYLMLTVSKGDNLTKCQTPCEPEEVQGKEDLHRPESEVPVSEPPVSESQAKKPVEGRGIDQLPPSESLPKHNEAPDRWSLGLTASGGLIASNNSVNINRLQEAYYSDAANYGFIGSSFSGESYSKTDLVWKHRLPLRFGLSVQYKLNNRFSLLSGISYTYLYSECSIPVYRNISYSQKLHYLGVPLGIGWQLWSSGHFRIYLSGSAMLEKCISASFDNKHSDDIYEEKPWQWSLNAAAGVEYSFTPQLGVYLEPSLGYYFDNGTHLEHYYKEHPLAPSVSFGLRFNIRK